MTEPVDRHATASADNIDDLDDAGLAALSYRELATLVNRLYARLGESPMAESAVRASSPDELRDRIRAVRRRFTPRETRRPVLAAPSAPVDAAPRADHSRSRRRGSAPRSERTFAVLVATDRALVARARAAARASGLVLVVVDSGEALITLVGNVTPTHVMIDERATAVDPGVLRELATRGSDVRRCSDAGDVLRALGEMQ